MPGFVLCKQYRKLFIVDASIVDGQWTSSAIPTGAVVVAFSPDRKKLEAIADRQGGLAKSDK